VLVNSSACSKRLVVVALFSQSKSWAAGILTLLTFACARSTSNTQKTQDATPQRGARVVVESSAAQFYEAQVMSASGSRLKVQSRVGGNIATVQAGNVYQLPPKTTSLAARALAICNIGDSRWVACRVSKSESAGADLEDALANTYRLPWAQVIVPGALTELNLKRLFEQSAENRDFERDVARAGNPQTLNGWIPVSGKSALVKVAGEWHTATILGERRGFVRVKLVGTRHEIETPRALVAPEPPYPLEILRRSRFALVRPNNQIDPWRLVRLVSSDTLESTIEDFEHGRRTAPVRDVCPLDSP
jgi:hypothetical protein